MTRDPARDHLDRLWRRGREFLGCDCAIMGGAMTWVSERHLVAAISNGGGFGIIASGSMSPKLLAGEIAATKALTDRPFGVNVITMHPELDALIDVCLDHRVGHVVLDEIGRDGAAVEREDGRIVEAVADDVGAGERTVVAGGDVAEPRPVRPGLGADVAVHPAEMGEGRLRHRFIFGEVVGNGMAREVFALAVAVEQVEDLRIEE